MPGGRGDEEYIEAAAKQAKKVIDDHFDDYPESIKQAVVKGVFDCYATNIVPTYILETGDHYK